MAEISTRALRRADLDRIIGTAREHPGFKVGSGGGVISSDRRELPNLGAYQLDKFGQITIRSGWPYQSDFVNTVLDVADACSGRVRTAWARLDINESGMRYERGKESDVDVMFGRDQYGPAISISVGTVSPGFNDLDYRARLYNRSIEVLGLSGRIDAVGRDGRLVLDVRDEDLLFPRNLSFGPSDYDARNHNLVRVGAAPLDGSNFLSLMLNTFSSPELRAKFPRLLESFGIEKIVGSEFTVTCENDDYDAIRGFLNESPIGPWKLSFSVTSGYTLDDLDRAVTENPSFLIRAFTIKVPKACLIDASIGYENGNFWIHFYFENLPDKARRRLEVLIAELAGGVENLDTSPR